MNAGEVTTPEVHAAGINSVVIVRDNGMYPEIPAGSIAFLGEPGAWYADGIYYIPTLRSTYRVTDRCDGSFIFSHDNVPKHPPHRTLTFEEFREIGCAPVLGIAKPYRDEFRHFLLERFGQVMQG